MAQARAANRFLIWGERGWIAGQLKTHLTKLGKDVHSTAVRMQNQAEVHKELDKIKPTHVINCAGKTGRPNVDWCEDHKLETIESNVIGPLILIKACNERNIHLTNLATGCIYASQYNADRTEVTSPPFKEEDPANFGGSFYSFTKSRVEDVLKFFPDCLVLRLRMPVSDDLHGRSFVTKITKYPKVVNVPNSHSILHDLLPVIVALAEHRETGVLNFTNPGAISHNEVLSLYKEIIDPSYTWQNFTLEEQAKVIKADRSNCELDCGKLLAKVKQYVGEGYELEVPEIHDSYRRCFGRMKEGMQQKGGAAS
ncbi:hypothetical protein LTR37_004611 [Vermiconidia calcicola]|uniref:Uncharacterized protein n=1 Tax=Vermiconidia calcicola TaxID=1690605 RepID=A0ACC3NLA9_9PEZI|nr:hypothetical protein LTR37_004611 [Vermiconidia calcicola]